MITKEEIKKILSSYNLETNKYGPTIYENNNELGITLDIKDPLFGFLTRKFIFNNKEDLEEFLKKYTWYKNNYQKYNIILKLDNYEIENPNLIYTFKNNELSLNDMLNLKTNLEENKESVIESNNKESYLINIENLTTYLIDLKNNNYKINLEKNNLKIKENDLKYELLNYLSEYYARPKNFEKKGVSLDNVFMPTNDINILNNNLNNIKDKNSATMKNYLETLINLCKEEELNDKNLLNIYSNSIYKYNIEILKKQIDFVRSKIASEKNFNLKGSKIHNIDEELKSFLKTSIAPSKLEVFLNDMKNNINTKYQSITDISNAYTIISGKTLDIKQSIVPSTEFSNETLSLLKNNYNQLPDNTKKALILYNSFYKNICNFIIDNNYPDLETIKNNFDIASNYEHFDEIIHNELNSHYLVNYFSIINFKTLEDYLNSLIEITKLVENTRLTLNGNLKVFSLNSNSKYLEFTLNPLYSKNNIYLIDIPNSSNIIYIPEKIEIDDDTDELITLNTNNIFYQGTITENNENLIVCKYNKITQNDLKNGIIITTELKLTSKTTFKLGSIKENEHE